MASVPSTKPVPAAEPDILQERPTSAEVLVGPASITVTVAVPNANRCDLDVFLTRHTIRMRSRANPSGLNLLIPLPVTVEPERYVLRYANGVFDFVVLRCSR